MTKSARSAEEGAGHTTAAATAPPTMQGFYEEPRRVSAAELRLSEDALGPRHFLNGRPVEQYDRLLLLTTEGWLRVKHEWAFCLNQHWFLSLADARRTLSAFQLLYNTGRRHGAHGTLTPAEFAATFLNNRQDPSSPNLT